LLLIHSEVSFTPVVSNSLNSLVNSLREADAVSNHLVVQLI